MNGRLHDDLAAERVRTMLEEGTDARLCVLNGTLGLRGHIGSRLVAFGEWIGGCRLRSMRTSATSR
jgi:hypothetical protein